MPNWKKILLNGGDGELTTLKLTNLTEDSIFALRPEKLSSTDFVALTQKIENGQFSSR